MTTYRPRWERPALFTLLALTAALYLWGLSGSGWANAFYSAAVQAGSQSWTALLFGSSDAANAITVDKTPAALWVMGLSARIFGFSSWSVLVPQALMGVAAVAVLYTAVRRSSSSAAALIAGVVMAATPVAALMFRFNNPDALLVLLLVVAAYCTVRAIEADASRWWLPLAGVAIGFGFLAKMLQAFLVVPVLAGVFLLAAHAPLRARLIRLAGAAAALVVSCGWYLVLVELWPADKRPYIGGSQQNSILELALGYNGLGRLTGNETGGLGNLNHDVGWGRLFGAQMGTPIAWLLPAAVIAVGAGLWITRTAPRTDPVRAALLLWGGWLAVTAVVLSFMNGIVHPYYTVALAPAVAACLGIGSPLVWQRRSDLRAATVLAGALAITALLSFVLLDREASWHPWLRWTIVVTGLGAAVLLLFAGRLRVSVTRSVAVAAMVAALAGPVAFSIATASTSHSGAIPSVGPSTEHRGMPKFLAGVTPGEALTDLLTTDADTYTWAAATMGSTSAASYQLATDAPVMAIGGFNGTDPAPTLAQFQQDVVAHRIHYFIAGEVMMGGREFPNSGSDEAQRISQWVEDAFIAQTVDGTTVYDLTGTAVKA